MKTQKSYLALADGTVFYGESAGAPVDSTGEAVFNTSMTGYQEIVSDPSYAGQFVTLTTAEVGNYGCAPADFESRGLFLSGLIVQELNEPSNFRSTQSLPELLKQMNRPALAGVDTRRLVLKLRECGTMKAYLHCAAGALPVEEAVRRANEWEGLDGQDYAAKVSVENPYVWNPDDAFDFHVVAYDFGIKFNILRELAKERMKVTVVPAWTPAADVLKYKPDGVFLSNGPADPSAVKGAIDAMRGLIGKAPVMGICLGHQIIGLACGGVCRRLKFGHHGGNHPVKNLRTGGVEITSQNHNFAVDANALPACVEITHINLNDQTVEGLAHRHEPVFSVQYHPESAPGPHDSKSCFKTFRQFLERRV